MFTLGIIYTIIYILTFINLLIITSLALPLNVITQQSISFFSTLLQKYTKYKIIFYLLIFILTGLPPVGLFFVKFNIFIYILYQTHFLLVITLFIIFFCNMLYYIQLFNVKNFKKDYYHQIHNVVLQNWSSTYLLVSKNNYKNFNLLFSVNVLILFITVCIFLYSDLFFICSL